MGLKILSPDSSNSRQCECLDQFFPDQHFYSQVYYKYAFYNKKLLKNIEVKSRKDSEFFS